MKKISVEEVPNLFVIVEGTSLHHVTLHDPALLRQRISDVIDMLRNSTTLSSADVNSFTETIECLDAAREELKAISDDGLVKVVEKSAGNTMSPEIKRFIVSKRSKALTTIIQASLGLAI